MQPEHDPQVHHRAEYRAHQRAEDGAGPGDVEQLDQEYTRQVFMGT